MYSKKVILFILDELIIFFNVTFLSKIKRHLTVVRNLSDTYIKTLVQQK